MAGSKLPTTAAATYGYHASNGNSRRVPITTYQSPTIFTSPIVTELYTSPKITLFEEGKPFLRYCTARSGHHEVPFSRQVRWLLHNILFSSYACPTDIRTLRTSKVNYDLVSIMGKWQIETWYQLLTNDYCCAVYHRRLEGTTRRK